MRQLEERLKEVLEQTKQFRAYYLTNEQAVRDQLINPILNTLGWNTANPNLVRPNSPNEDGKIPDYTLFKNGKSVLVVEAKNLKTELKDEKIISQLAEYCYKPGIEFGIITSGVKWLLFNTFQKNPLERIVWIVDLEDEDINITNVLKRLSSISYGNVEKLESSIEKIKILEKVWGANYKNKEHIKMLVSGFIRDKSERENPNQQLSNEDIENFVETKLEEMFGSDLEQINIPTEDTGKTYLTVIEDPVIKGKKGPRIKIKVIFPDGIVIQNNKVAETFVQSIKKMGVDKVKSLNIQINNIPLIDNKKDRFYQQHEVSGPLYIITHTSTKHKIALLEDISEKLNSNIKIEII